MEYLRAFICGGVLCAIGQIFIDKTNLTPARILTGYVVDWGGAGATVPLTGFGYCLAKGVKEALGEVSGGHVLSRLAAVFAGGMKATSCGISAAIFFGLLAAVLFKPKEKR